MPLDSIFKVVKRPCFAKACGRVLAAHPFSVWAEVGLSDASHDHVPPPTRDAV